MLQCALLDQTHAQAQAFEEEISAFEQTDQTTPPPADPILFIGSSSIRFWPNLPSYFPSYPVINRGFGGSQMSDVLYYFDRIVIPYNPMLVLVYEGDNDLASGKPANRVYADYLAFVARVKAQLPGTDIALISTKPSPNRSQYLEVTRQFNKRLAKLANRDPRIWFIDIFTPMLNESGQPRLELFSNDQLHMNQAGYELWQSIIDPVLAAWASPITKVLLFDFGAGEIPTDDDPSNVWNNISEEVGCLDSGKLTGLVTINGRTTQIDLIMQSRFHGANQNGTWNFADFPANATRDSLYGHTEAFLNLANVFPKFKLTGLDPLWTYDFTFYASRMGTHDNRETRYTVVGMNSGFTELNVAANINTFATVSGIKPDPTGQITISIAPTENNNSSKQFTYLGVMKLEATADSYPKTVAIVGDRHRSLVSDHR